MYKGLWWSLGFPRSITGLMMLMVELGGTTGRLTGDNAVIIAAAGAHFATEGGAKQHKYCELRGRPPAPGQPEATQGGSHQRVETTTTTTKA